MAMCWHGIKVLFFDLLGFEAVPFGAAFFVDAAKAHISPYSH